MAEVFEAKDIDGAEHMLSAIYASLRLTAQGERRGCGYRARPPSCCDRACPVRAFFELLTEV